MYFKGKWIEKTSQINDIIKKKKPTIKNVPVIDKILKRRAEQKQTISTSSRYSICREPMEIVFVMDKNYIKYFNICVKTVLKYNPKAHITVVSTEKLDIPYDNVVLDVKGEFKHRKNDRITSATYLKLFLPQLPYDKILYMDGDVICQGSLEELWNTDCPYICVTESHMFGQKQAKEHNHEKYGLAGVMLMNLKALREDNFTEKAFQPFDYDKYSLWCHEETIINHLFYDKLKFVDKKYNYCHKRTYKNPIDEKDAVLLHFPGPDKSGMFSLGEIFCQRYGNLLEIKEFIKDKRVAIVGNSENLFNSEYGELIDSFDIVIRFNYGFIVQPISQGTRTDIVMMATELTQEQRDSYGATYYINRMKRFNNGTPHHLLNADIVRASSELNGSRASTGFMAIDLCVESGCKSIDLFGFDWEKLGKTFYNLSSYKTMHHYDDEEKRVRAYYCKVCDLTIH